jgi:hypothetical protein
MKLTHFIVKLQRVRRTTNSIEFQNISVLKVVHEDIIGFTESKKNTHYYQRVGRLTSSRAADIDVLGYPVK